MIKLPITDQFLLDLVAGFSDATDELSDFLLGNKYKRIDMLFGIENPVFKKYKKKMGGQKFSQLIYKLKVNNIIKAKSLEGKSGIIITKKGFSKLLKTSFKFEPKEKRNDGKWIMIIFDLPKYHQKSRNLLRSVLKNLGYKILQYSVWVCPFDVSDKTERLLQTYDLDRYVKIFLIEELERNV